MAEAHGERGYGYFVPLKSSKELITPYNCEDLPNCQDKADCQGIYWVYAIIMIICPHKKFRGGPFGPKKLYFSKTTCMKSIFNNFYNGL